MSIWDFLKGGSTIPNLTHTTVPTHNTELGNKVIKAVYEHTPVGSLTKSFVDNVFKDKVIPIKGSIIHCSLFGVEHTGVYIGNGRIVELLGTGYIRETSVEGFIDGTNAISIYVACNATSPLGSKVIANRAIRMIDKKRKYNLVMDNCHQFTAGCITGDFENYSNAFTFLENKIIKKMNSGNDIVWRVWDLD